MAKTITAEEIRSSFTKEQKEKIINDGIEQVPMLKEAFSSANPGQLPILMESLVSGYWLSQTLIKEDPESAKKNARKRQQMQIVVAELIHKEGVDPYEATARVYNAHHEGVTIIPNPMLEFLTRLEMGTL